jgi:hypothetical protein
MFALVFNPWFLLLLGRGCWLRVRGESVQKAGVDDPRRWYPCSVWQRLVPEYRDIRFFASLKSSLL